MLVSGNFCNRSVITQTLTITDPGGGNTDFIISGNPTGVTISPSSGITPATVQVRVDPTAFQNQNGTVVVPLTITSATAVNVPPPVRLLVNNRNPDQRGTLVDIPGTLTDVLADPDRNRFYVVRQDLNQVLVFDSTTYKQIATLRTATTPTQMAITFDQQYLIVGHDNSQFAYVYDLDTLQPQIPITFPRGHYPRSIAASGKAMLALVRDVAGERPGAIDRIDFLARTATQLPSLGHLHEQRESRRRSGAGAQRRHHPGGHARWQRHAVRRQRRYVHGIAQGLHRPAGRLCRFELQHLRGGQQPAELFAGAAGHAGNASGAPSGFAFVDQTRIPHHAGRAPPAPA